MQAGQVTSPHYRGYRIPQNPPCLSLKGKVSYL